MKKYLFFVLLLFNGKTMLRSQPPTDNPFDSRYHIKGHWSNDLQWKNVTDASNVDGLIDKDGHLDSAIMHTTMKTISANGGGVLFFRAGIYLIGFDITIYNGVILRGADPVDSRDAINSNYSPPTKFQFPEYKPTFTGNGTPDNTAFKKIGNVKNAAFGLVNLDINRGIVYVPDWDDGVLNMNRSNIFLFGVRANNAIDHRTIFLADYKGQGWERYPPDDSGTFTVAFNKGVVANCRINDAITDDFEMKDFLSNDGYVFKDTKIKFQYGMQMGVSMHGYSDTCQLELLDNYIKGFYISKIGAEFPGKKIMHNNQLVFLPCQDLISNEFYSRQEEEHTSKAFDEELYVSKEHDSLPYRILKPKNYDPRKKYPFVLFLHGHGQQGNKNPLIHVVYVYSNDEIREKYPCFVVVPHIGLTDNFTTKLDGPPTKSMKLSIDLMKELMEKYSIDKSKVFVSGISSGGSGAVEALVRYPELFTDAIVLSAFRALSSDQMERMKNIHFVITSGSNDNRPPVKVMRSVVAALKDQGNKVDYFEYEGAGHWSWINACDDKKFLEKILR